MRAASDASRVFRDAPRSDPEKTRKETGSRAFSSTVTTSAAAANSVVGSHGIRLDGRPTDVVRAMRRLHAPRLGLSIAGEGGAMPAGRSASVFAGVDARL